GVASVPIDKMYRDFFSGLGGFPGLFVCRFAVERNFYPPGRLTAFMKMTYNESINHHVYL
ncbi:hypothetical protein, partial [Mitsuokella jalaludinii]|uniref:hypothetical protein n=1 Tax=Mitsuokella jalaludinii TaxID=187979 RepID=UPI001D0164C8